MYNVKYTTKVVMYNNTSFPQNVDK